MAAVATETRATAILLPTGTARIFRNDGTDDDVGIARRNQDSGHFGYGRCRESIIEGIGKFSARTVAFGRFKLHSAFNDGIDGLRQIMVELTGWRELGCATAYNGLEW